MATSQPQPQPKGILKKPPPPSSAPEPSASTPPPQPLTRPELLAKQETTARLLLLQKLRDTELKPPTPLETFELLSHLPTSTHPAASPLPADVSLLLTHLSQFQPQEYLDLIEERNCLSKCGYALCPRPCRSHAGPFKISSGSGQIARTEDLNKWCSDACARRGMYLKVQLDRPSYVRDETPGGSGGMVVKLELWDEGHGNDMNGKGKKKAEVVPAAAGMRGSEDDRTKLAQAMAQLELDKQKQEARKKTQTLAGERGDPKGGVFSGVSRVEVTIRESDVADGPVQPPAQLDEDAFLRVEGYKPSFDGAGAGFKKLDREGAESGEDDDDDDEFFTLRF